MNEDLQQLVSPFSEINEAARFVNFMKMPKSLILMWSKLGMSSSVFCCYLYLLSGALWDEKHPETLGYYPIATSKLPKLLGHQPSTVRSWLTELQDLGLIAITADGYAVLINYRHLVRQLSNEAKNLNRKGEDNLISMFPKLKNLRPKSEKSKGGTE